MEVTYVSYRETKGLGQIIKGKFTIKMGPLSKHHSPFNLTSSDDDALQARQVAESTQDFGDVQAPLGHLEM